MIKKHLLIMLISVCAMMLFFHSCGNATKSNTDYPDDASSGSVAAGAVGGALAGSDSNGTMASFRSARDFSKGLAFVQQAQAANACPTLLTPNGSGCTETGSAVDLTYNSCSFANSSATYSGKLEVSLSGLSPITCGTFPNPNTFANDQSIQRQFVSTSGVPGTAVYSGVSSDLMTIDHSSINLTNFDNQTITANIGSGYGSQVVFDGTGLRKRLIVRERLSSSLFDFTMDGTMNIADASGVRLVNGSVIVYHNKLKVVGTSNFSNVIYTNSSCLPIGGTITTIYTAGTNVSPTSLGSVIIGKNESVTFNSDATAVFVDTNGVSSTVSVTRCF